MEIYCSLHSTHLSKSLHSHSFLPPLKKCYGIFPQHRKLVVQCSISEAKGIRWGCEIDSMENAYRLQNWLNKEGLPPQKLAIQKVDVGGRGLVALKNIRKGEKLLYVPQNLIITPDSAWSSPALGDILGRNSVPEWPFLAVYLISEASLNRSSKWNAYISALPRHPYSILQWSRAEVEMYLAASPVKIQAIECINDVNETLFGKCVNGNRSSQ